jgi:hypothetical protein
MAHFAELDESNIVTQVIVVNDIELCDEQGLEVESLGVEFCTRLLGGFWVQTSYNGTIRKNFAGIGYAYDAARDAFIPPKANCHVEEAFNEERCWWTCANEAHQMTP